MSGKDHPSSFPPQVHTRSKRELMKGQAAAGEAGPLRQAGSQSGERTQDGGGGGKKSSTRLNWRVLWSAAHGKKKGLR
ncbi:unnamed protein product [Sphagnum jensenii]|uniref:Uncharacterized protein n=1 Tax=Sphagnum jensenii TaxID=128206 RepID=A0ABP1BKP8_9BRYO